MRRRNLLIALVTLALLCPGASAEEASLPVVRLNQVGYRPQDEKRIALVNMREGYEILSLPDRVSVLQNIANEPVLDEASGDMIAYEDISGLRTPGEYIVHTRFGDSQPFVISGSVYRDLADAALGFFYVQRCGQTLAGAKAGQFAHGMCHTAPAVVYGAEKTRAITGGWHSAGEYGRYTVPTAKALLDLLLTYHDFPGAYSSETLLGEIRYGLAWLVQMQDAETGAVHHKLVGETLPSIDTAADRDDRVMYLLPPSSQATADFATVMAYASAIFRSMDAAYADRLLAAAERAYAWLEENPDVLPFENPEGMQTGGYADEIDTDERAAACAALYLATGNAAYQEALRPLLGIYTGLGWSDMGMYAVLLYLQVPRGQRDRNLYQYATDCLISAADELREAAWRDGYGISIDHYTWGSNGLVANHAMVLLAADAYVWHQEYRQVAQNHLHYLLGRNGNAISYVTGFGENSVENPHHRPSVCAGEAAPGMLSGGPNTGLEDGVQADVLSDLPPARQYVDHQDSYATNEVAIYWNSALVYVLAAYQ